MLNSVDAIAQLLQGTFLENAEIRQLDIPQTDEVAFEIHVNRAEALDAWGLLKSHLTSTERYPIVTCTWGIEDSSAYFSRFYCEEEQTMGWLSGTSPTEILWEHVTFVNHPHPPTPSPIEGEGEPDRKSLSRSGRGLSACGIQEKGEGCKSDMLPILSGVSDVDLDAFLSGRSQSEAEPLDTLVGYGLSSSPLFCVGCEAPHTKKGNRPLHHPPSRCNPARTRQRFEGTQSLVPARKTLRFYSRSHSY